MGNLARCAGGGGIEMNREQAIELMREAGAGYEHPRPNDYAGIIDVFAKFAALVAAAERRKHQADIEAWKAEAVTAEKWRGMALAKDPMQPGKAVQVIQQEAAAAEREACAKVCDAIADVGKDDKSIEGNLLSGCLSTAAQAIRTRNTNKETK